MTQEDGMRVEEELAVTLTTRLDQAAHSVPVPPPPVATIIRNGRARRRRRRTATALGAALLVAGGVPLAWTALGSDASRPAVAPVASRPEFSGAARVLQPYEAVDIGAGLQLALRADGYLVGAAGELPRGPQEDGQPVGDLPEAPTYHFPGYPLPGNRLILVGMLPGAEVPSRVEATWQGRTQAADLVTLPGEPGWCAFHVDLGSRVGEGAVSLTVYGADGEVVDVLEAQPAAG